MKLSFQSGQKPLWSQLYDILESRILNGDYKEGEVLPSEMALMEEFDTVLCIGFIYFILFLSGESHIPAEVPHIGNET